MTCEQCKYHTYIDGTHFCDSINHKRRSVRISEEDAEKDIDCLWADKAESEDKDADKKCTYKETGCGSCKRQLDCPIEADKAESEDKE